MSAPANMEGAKIEVGGKPMTGLHRRYVAAGQEVLQDGQHFADARDCAAADLITAGLNLVEAQIARDAEKHRRANTKRTG